ncbi:MAG: methyltransferase domain-containing protein [Candidatus Thermoplasmatota archaeon]|nr:methyltransferase domain-containing protein [Candidatus Thermoplasmatota archaeon]MBS3789880.1 methyltransferase domain-containing protein [Candidatus Thermoplasmatota archaeon]
MDAIERTMRTYDQIAEEYCRKTERQGDREFQEKMLDRTLSFLPPSPRIIDLGCGDGRDTQYLQEKGADVVGIDISRGMIDLARKKYTECAFLRSDMRDTVFPNDTFQGAWASTSLSNIPKSEVSRVEKEVYRILEQGSIFCFSFKVGEKEGFEESIVEGFETYQSYYTLEELKRELNLFDVIDSREYPEEIFNNSFMYCWARAK